MRKKLHLRYWIAFGFLALLLMSFIVWNINSGSIEISVREIMEILFLGKGEDTALNIIWEIRLPRILAAIILGGALSVSGFLLQTFFGNPIASPFVLGISSGAKPVSYTHLVRSVWKYIRLFLVLAISLVRELLPSCL